MSFSRIKCVPVNRNWTRYDCLRRPGLVPTISGVKSNELGKEAAAARERDGLSLRDVAKKARVSPQSVYDVENGVGGLKATVSVLKALGVKRMRIRSLVIRNVVRELQLA